MKSLISTLCYYVVGSIENETFVWFLGFFGKIILLVLYKILVEFGIIYILKMAGNGNFVSQNQLAPSCLPASESSLWWWPALSSPPWWGRGSSCARWARPSGSPSTPALRSCAAQPGHSLHCTCSWKYLWEKFELENQQLKLQKSTKPIREPTL